MYLRTSLPSCVFHKIVDFPRNPRISKIVCVACSSLSDSRMTHKWKARENVSAWPSLLSFYFRVRAFSIPRTRLSRSLERAMFCVVTLPVINVSDHENDNENEKIKTNKSKKKKTEKLWTWGSLFGRSLCCHSTTDVVKLHQNGNGIVAWVSTIAVLVEILSNNYGDGYTKTSLKEIRAASNFIALMPSRLIRQMLANFSGV